MDLTLAQHPKMTEQSAHRFPQSLPAKWKALLEAEVEKPYFRALSAFLRDEYRSKAEIFPSNQHVLRALQAVDFDDVNVVILGQDPYHGPGQATGWSFAVPNSLVLKPPSLKNIFKEIQSDLDKKVDPTRSELSHWVDQGVLLLNTVLTVRRNEAFSHRGKGWEMFTDKIISLLSARERPIVFILWGAASRKKKELIRTPPHYILESAHPSPLSAYQGFLGSKPFSRANKILRETGSPPIDWEVTY
jgi:uracil-DNA glycosylase